MTRKQILQCLHTGHRVTINRRGVSWTYGLIAIDNTITGISLGSKKILYVESLDNCFTEYFDLSTATIVKNNFELLPVGTKVKLYDWAKTCEDCVYKDSYEITEHYKGMFYKLDSEDFTYIGTNEVYPVYEKDFLQGLDDYVKRTPRDIQIKDWQEAGKKRHYWWVRKLDKVHPVKSDHKYTKKEAKSLFGKNLITKVK